MGRKAACKERWHVLGKAAGKKGRCRARRDVMDTAGEKPLVSSDTQNRDLVEEER